MSGSSGYAPTLLGYSEYDNGITYSAITTLPPLSNGAPGGKGVMSSKAQALRERLAKAENTFDAGEDDDEHQSLQPRNGSGHGGTLRPTAGASSAAAAHPSMGPSINQVTQLPHLQQEGRGSAVPAPHGGTVDVSGAHAYAPPGWHQRVVQQQQGAEIAGYAAAGVATAPEHGYRAAHEPAGALSHADPQIRKIVELLEARAQHGGFATSQPDTTTEDLVSLAFVGMFFMLAIHALSPPVVYRR